MAIWTAPSGAYRYGIPIGLVLTGLFALSSPLAAQQMQQGFQQFQIDRGATLYGANCRECHTDGSGVPGVNFRTGQFSHGSTDQDLLSAMHDGIPGTAMPPHNFDGGELAALLAYVRSLAQTDAVPVKLGDAEKGRALFEQSGCLGCHRVGTEGAHTALNLSNAGSLHPPSYLERALIDPNAILALTPESRLVRVVTNNGKLMTGRRLNEDTFTLQIIDDHENLVSLDKADLRSVTILKESPMPSEKGKLTDDQLSDLVAYLVSLKGSGPQILATQYGSPPKIGSAYYGQVGGIGGPAPNAAARQNATPSTPPPASAGAGGGR